MGTEEELTEKIADRLYHFDDKPFKDETHYKLAKEILADTEEAGYKSPEEVTERMKETFKKIRFAVKGETVVFGWALDPYEIQWIYKMSKQVGRK